MLICNTSILKTHCIFLSWMIRSKRRFCISRFSGRLRICPSVVFTSSIVLVLKSSSSIEQWNRLVKEILDSSKDSFWFVDIICQRSNFNKKSFNYFTICLFFFWIKQFLRSDILDISRIIHHDCFAHFARRNRLDTLRSKTKSRSFCRKSDTTSGEKKHILLNCNLRNA